MNDTVEQLIHNPNFKPSANAQTDIESGQVDARIVRTLLTLTEKHTINVSLIKTGHPLGPRTPGGYPNSHFYYRAVDITAVDGISIQEHGGDPAILDVGRILRGIPPQERPDHIFGPQEWHTALRYPASTGFRSDPFHNSIHVDHIHLSFETENGTENQE